jgi:hypothetical protein
MNMSVGSRFYRISMNVSSGKCFFPLIVLVLLTSCTSDLNSRSTDAETKALVNLGCSNLPNIYLRNLDSRPASEPGRISRQAFSELARLEPIYLSVATAFLIVDDALDLGDGYEQRVWDAIYFVNSLCEGIGSLTP